MIVGRLAPTPSGALHLGNALAFAAAWLSVRGAGGRLVYRLEDLDRGRARADVAAGQRDDLAWLGITWDVETAPQSARTYALDGIPAYACTCNRAARLAGACACRERAGPPPGAHVMRFRSPRTPVDVVDRARGTAALIADDDPVLVQADGAATYPLAVVLDDARDGVTEVVRGADLYAATASQVAIARAAGLPAVTYLHTPLLLGADGKKLGKSHGAEGIAAMRARGVTAREVWARLLPLLGIDAAADPARARLDPATMPRGPFRLDDAGRAHAVADGAAEAAAAAEGADPLLDRT